MRELNAVPSIINGIEDGFAIYLERRDL